jgi:hypothetical protein
MATRATTTRRNPIPVAVVIVAFGSIMLIGCADSAALKYEQEAHAQKVLSWCRTVSGAATRSLQEDCVERAWAGIPPSAFWTKYHGHVPLGTETTWAAMATR